MAIDQIDLRSCPRPQTLKDMAQERTGLEDFGDPGRDKGLDALVRSMNAETWQDMSGEARELAVDYLVHQLSTRLKLMADRKAYPQIAQEQVTAPLIVVGAPRTGSTVMHTLISLDPDNLSPEQWLCLEPSPPLALGPPTQQRRELAEQRMSKLFAPVPDILITHPYMIDEGAGALAECGSDILSMAFTAQQLWCFWGGDIYRRYLLEADHSAAVEFYHDFLQHCQWGANGSRWTLKGAEHMIWLTELAEQFPDAKFIWTHRDLSQQLASVASVTAVLLGLRGHPVTPEARRAQGREAIEFQRENYEKGVRARDAIGDDRFIDVSYHAMIADPFETVERIYDACGLTFSDKHAANIAKWREEHPQNKHGAHKHSPEEFGMEADDINRRFASYVDRFGFGFGIRPDVMA